MASAAIKRGAPRMLYDEKGPANSDDWLGIA